MANEDSLSLAAALRPALLQVSRRLRQEAHKAGLSVQDVMVLNLIRSAPGVGVCDLADAQRISRPAMSSRIKKLEAADWVARRSDAADGRRFGLVLTAAGVRQLATVRRLRNDWLAARISNLDPGDRDRLAAVVEPLLKLVGEPA